MKNVESSRCRVPRGPRTVARCTRDTIAIDHASTDVCLFQIAFSTAISVPSINISGWRGKLNVEG